MGLYWDGHPLQVLHLRPWQIRRIRSPLRYILRRHHPRFGRAQRLKISRVVFCFSAKFFWWWVKRLESEKIATVKDADGTSEPTIFSEKWWLNNDNLPW